MSDDLDAANDLAQAERDAGIAAVRAASKTRIQLTGFCLHCAEITKKLFATQNVALIMGTPRSF